MATKRSTLETLRNCLIFGLLFIWLLTGMFVFKAVEHPAELKQIENKQKGVDNFVQIIQLASNLSEFLKNNHHPNATTNDVVVNDDFDPVIIKIDNSSLILQFPIDFFQRNNFTWIDTVIDHCPVHSSVPKWDLSGSFFFVLIVVSTIGYGNYAPNTNAGRSLCILYAVIGIPMMALCVEIIRAWLIEVVEFLRESCRQLVNRRRQQQQMKKEMKKKKKNKGQTTNEKKKRSERSRKKKKKLRSVANMLIVASVGISAFLVLPAALFNYLEGWGFLSSLYYAQISLSTIGFGDFVGGQTQEGAIRPFYRLFLCVWIFFGIAFISTVQLMISRVLLNRIDRILNFIKRKGCTHQNIDNNDDDDDEYDEDNCKDEQIDDMDRSSPEGLILESNPLHLYPSSPNSSSSASSSSSGNHSAVQVSHF